MKPVRFHHEARAELARGASHYAEVSNALSKRFIDAVEEALLLASKFPKMGAPYTHGTRRYFPKKFPYSIVYIERDDEIIVIALAPFARKPGYWRSRRKDGQGS